jgi:DNA helicase-2/ATP-dependent DNA helicase PcrA
VDEIGDGCDASADTVGESPARMASRPDDDLTEAQRTAVEHFEGPLLVVAGPGSGKTRVITRRIARLIDRGVRPRNILAITFTNKAAREMEERVGRLVPGAPVWVSTFHRLCARLLRQYGSAVGLAPNFTILDMTDQRTLVKQVLHDLDIDGSHYPPARIGNRISTAKNKLQTPDMMRQAVEEGRGSFQDQVVSKVYTGYQKALLASNGVDFDDLLLHVALLLRDSDVIRAELDERFRFVLVDEYQDTNIAQYEIVRALSIDHPNLCATGDPDQSIYGWRGAEIGNILRFERDYPDTRVVRLEQNYRSTPEILRVADRLIAHNTRRKAKDLFTENPAGPEPELLCFLDERDEADGIARMIVDQVEQEGRRWSDFAIFYRINALSRGIEQSLVRAKIPYQVAAGVAFYERTEIKDVLAYLRLIHNPADRTAFLRIVNVPARSLGKTSVERLVKWADATGLSPLDMARAAGDVTGLSKKAVAAFKDFAALIDKFAAVSTGGVEGLIRAILDATHYTAPWERSPLEEDQQRLANVQEILSAARDYDAEHPDNPDLEGFLENASLVADTDAVDEDAGKVTLMTLHAAKGLEYPVVYVVAVEHNLLPHERAIREGDGDELEEERRLLFVGMTRARERLSLTQTQVRQFRGSRYATIPSLFIAEAGLRPSAAGMEGVLRTQVLEGRDALKSFHSNPAARTSRADDDEGTPVDADESTELSDDALDFDPSAWGDAPATAPAPTARAPRLMTGADLLRGQADTDDAPFPNTPDPFAAPRGPLPQLATTPGRANADFPVGQRVKHPTLGPGEVLHSQGQGRWRTVTVRFDLGCEQSFVATKCPLELE